MCVSGLILLILSITFPAWRLSGHVRSYYENTRDFEMLKVDLEQAQYMNDLLGKESEALNKERNEVLQELEQLKQSAQAKPHLTSTDKGKIAIDFNRLKELNDQLEVKHRQWMEKALA